MLFSALVLVISANFYLIAKILFSNLEKQSIKFLEAITDTKHVLTSMISE